MNRVGAELGSAKLNALAAEREKEKREGKNKASSECITPSKERKSATAKRECR